MLYPIELWAQRTPPGDLIGRGREIRTPDILLPKQARYQTALYPEGTRKAKVLGESRGRDDTRSSEKSSTRITKGCDQFSSSLKVPLLPGSHPRRKSTEKTDGAGTNLPKIRFLNWHCS